MSPIIMIFLSIIGLWISVYFTGVYYKWFHPSVFWMPQVCQLKEASCMTVLGTPRAKLFGIPNSVFGIGVYLFLIGMTLGLSFLSPKIALVLMAFAVFRSIYLAYSLLFVTKIPCPLCFTTHIINLILFFLVFKLAFSV